MNQQHRLLTTCINFNGLMSKTCKVGIKYTTVGEGANVPCLNKGGKCDQCRFYTAEEIQKREDEGLLQAAKVLAVYAKIKEQIMNGGPKSGKIDCECGGKVSYVSAQSNGHIWAKCNKCSIAFNE